MDTYTIIYDKYKSNSNVLLEFIYLTIVLVLNFMGNNFYVQMSMDEIFKYIYSIVHCSIRTYNNNKLRKYLYNKYKFMNDTLLIVSIAELSYRVISGYDYIGIKYKISDFTYELGNMFHFSNIVTNYYNNYTKEKLSEEYVKNYLKQTYSNIYLSSKHIINIQYDILERYNYTLCNDIIKNFEGIPKISEFKDRPKIITKMSKRSPKKSPRSPKRSPRSSPRSSLRSPKRSPICSTCTIY